MQPPAESSRVESIYSSFLDSLSGAFERNDPMLARKQLERENLSPILSMYEAIGARDWDRLSNLLGPEFEFELLGGPELPNSGESGRDRVIRALKANFEAVEEEWSRMENLVAQGDEVVAICHERGRIRETGEAYDLRFLVHFRVMNRRLVSARQWVLPG